MLLPLARAAVLHMAHGARGSTIGQEWGCWASGGPSGKGALRVRHAHAKTCLCAPRAETGFFVFCRPCCCYKSQGSACTRLSPWSCGDQASAGPGLAPASCLKAKEKTVVGPSDERARSRIIQPSDPQYAETWGHAEALISGASGMHPGPFCLQARTQEARCSLHLPRIALFSKNGAPKRAQAIRSGSG